MHHTAHNAPLLIIAASHVGVDDTGNIGKIKRILMEEETTACGAAIAAYTFLADNPGLVDAVAKRDACAYPRFDDTLDQQQNYIQQWAATVFAQVSTSTNPMAALAIALSKKIHQDLHAIFPPRLTSPVMVVTGVQINLEGPDEEDGKVSLDYFMINAIEVVDHTGAKREIPLDRFAGKNKKAKKSKKSKEEKAKKEKKKK